jgi:hypothetical protein
MLDVKAESNSRAFNPLSSLPLLLCIVPSIMLRIVIPAITELFNYKSSRVRAQQDWGGHVVIRGLP